MKIKEIILGILAAIGSVFAAIFYVLFQQKKDENLKQETELQKKEAEIEKASDVIKQTNETNERLENAMEAAANAKRENEEKLNEAVSGNDLAHCNAKLDFLRQQAERGANRNKVHNGN